MSLTTVYWDHLGNVVLGGNGLDFGARQAF